MSDWYQTIHALNERRVPVAAVTIVRGAGIGRKIVVTDSDVTGSLDSPQLDDTAITLARNAMSNNKSEIVTIAEGVDAFVEVFAVAPQLIIVGAVHVAQALVPIARALGYYIVVIDARQQLAKADRFPDVDELIVAWPDDAFRDLTVTNTTAIAILTHDPKFDEPALLNALATDAVYIGAVGSRSTNADRRERLRVAGVGEDQLARIHGPIGLDIGGKSPEEMAISIMAEIIAVRNGRSGNALFATAGAIRA